MLCFGCLILTECQPLERQLTVMATSRLSQAVSQSTKKAYGAMLVVNVQLVGGLPSGYMRSLMGFIYGERGNLLLGDTGSEWRAP